MKNRNHLIALILVAGMGYSSMLNGKKMSMCSYKDGQSVSKKLDLRWEGVRSTLRVFSIDQFIAGFFSKLYRNSSLELRYGFFFLPFIFSCPVFLRDIDPNLFINAP